ILTVSNEMNGKKRVSQTVTCNKSKQQAAWIPLPHTVTMSFDNYFTDIDSLTYIDQYLSQIGYGIDLPAAIILETVQGEGGINAASDEWLQGIEKIAKKYNILLIVDDIQAGCGRTGTFFIFERAGIKHD